MTDDRLAPGDLAPDFTLPDADGREVSLSSLRGQRVIIYFYPAAMTPGCTKQACDFRDSRSDLSDGRLRRARHLPGCPGEAGQVRRARTA